VCAKIGYTPQIAVLIGKTTRTPELLDFGVAYFQTKPDM
jgi:hypothetical protein